MVIIIAIIIIIGSFNHFVASWDYNLTLPCPASYCIFLNFFTLFSHFVQVLSYDFIHFFPCAETSYFDI